MKLVSAKTPIVDMHGRTATPGMIDTHSHYAEAGTRDLFEIGLGDTASVAEIVGRVQRRVAASMYPTIEGSQHSDIQAVPEHRIDVG